MQEWSCGISSWIWEHAAGSYGVDVGREADKSETVLWHRSIPPVQPDAVLPLQKVWPSRGVYHTRTGWQSEAQSDDLALWFYSGKFNGGHAQEDQNQFSLVGYGESFVIDHGIGSMAKESEAHNIVFIDGKGQHNAGNSIGTDGQISAYLVGNMADWVTGDATAAYGTYSEYNVADWPFAGADWSWGYRDANPVEYARRHIVAVRGDGIAPYFVLMDDIRKDDATHTYQWRMHTLERNDVDVSVNPFVVSGHTGVMDMHLLRPAHEDVIVAVDPFDNLMPDPDARLIQVSVDAVEPGFAFLLMPRAMGDVAPVVTTVPRSWGFTCEIDWGGGLRDRLIRNDSRMQQIWGDIVTDAFFAVVRTRNGVLEGYLAADMSALTVAETPEAIVIDGRMTCELSGPTLHIDRYDAQFFVLDRGINEVRYRDQELGFVAAGDYVTMGGATAIGDAPRAPSLAVSAWPNPFNPVTTIRVDGLPAAPTRVMVYDVAGRRVRTLWDAPLGTPSRTFPWDGRNDAGEPVATGVYLLRVSNATTSLARKLVLLK
jgi:hypothetical protein